MTETFEGGCHCGRVRFWVRADLARLSECNCSVCVKKGILHLMPEHFELLSGEADLATYRFNTGTAKHLFCRHCGIHAFGVPRLNPDAIRSTPAASMVSTRPSCGRPACSMAAIGRRPRPGAAARKPPRADLLR